MTDLSPAAQAVFNAFNDRYEASGPLEDWMEPCIATALRALADQIASDIGEPNRCINIEPERDVAFIGAWHIWNTTRTTHAKLLAIAAELEAQ